MRIRLRPVRTRGPRRAIVAVRAFPGVERDARERHAGGARDAHGDARLSAGGGVGGVDLEVLDAETRGEARDGPCGGVGGGVLRLERAGVRPVAAAQSPEHLEAVEGRVDGDALGEVAAVGAGVDALAGALGLGERLGERRVGCGHAAVAADVVAGGRHEHAVLIGDDARVLARRLGRIARGRVASGRAGAAARSRAAVGARAAAAAARARAATGAAACRRCPRCRRCRRRRCPRRRRFRSSGCPRSCCYRSTRTLREARRYRRVRMKRVA